MLALLVGCPAAEGNPPPGQPEQSGPCVDFWGPVPEGGRIWADAAAAEGGDGSFSAPFATLDEALAEARLTGIRSVAVAAGEYPGHYLLSQQTEAWQDSDLEIAGCGREATQLTGIEMEEQVGDDLVLRLQPVFDIVSGVTSGIYVHDLAAVGGRRGLVVRLNAGMNGPIVFERVDVLESVRMGVLVDGDATVAHLLDVRVEGVEQEDGQFGWGIGIQTSASFLSELAEPNVLQDVVVTDVQGLGILGDGGWVEILDTEVSDVAKVDDTLGRGIQLQQWTRGTLDGVSVFDVNDASVFLESPGRIVDPVEVYDCLLGPTAEATVPEGGGESAADGLVATQAIDVPSSAADFQVIVDGTELDGNPRVHLLAEAITLSVGTNNIFGDGTGFPVVSQGSAAVQGIDGGEPGHPAEELGAEDALQLNKELVQMDQLGSD